jgi:hypothetical protein
VQKYSDLQIVLAGLFASGGLGYIFAASHHFISWYWICDSKILDNGPLIKSALGTPLWEEITSRKYITKDQEKLLEKDVRWTNAYSVVNNESMRSIFRGACGFSDGQKFRG